MLKKRDLSECGVLFDLMQDPAVFPFVRQKASTPEEFMFVVKQAIEAEENREMISRTITNEWGAPIGTISLFDIENGSGFLGTWLGKPYFGQGYNQKAKEAFFNELFLDQGIDTIFMKIRLTNIRSKKAAEKLPYVVLANLDYPTVYAKINPDVVTYDLYAITKERFLTHQYQVQSFLIQPEGSTLKEA